MKEFEAFLAKAIKQKSDFGSVNFLPISYDDRAIIDKLKKEGLIDNVRYIRIHQYRSDLWTKALVLILICTFVVEGDFLILLIIR